MNEAPPPKRPGDSAPLDPLIFRARLSELWERVWPALVAFFVVIGVFVSISWLGLWLHTPGWGRALGLTALVASLIWPIVLLLRVKMPSRQELLLRIDRDSNLPHRPASTLDDALANTQADDSTRALWRLHQRRAEQTAKLLK